MEVETTSDSNQNISIDFFYSFKGVPDTQNLDIKTQSLFSSLFGSIDKNRRNRKNKKNNTSILKNQKIQSKKDNISNKVNLILNKLSENNVDNLLSEFIENINQVDKDSFEDIQKYFYLKIISEINFVKIYLQFLKYIGFLYGQVQGYDLSFFISTVESKFMLDYTTYDIPPESSFEYVKNLNDETKRINNLILIKSLTEYGFCNELLINICDNIIINQDTFLPDIYYWFNAKQRQLTESEINRVKILTKSNTISPREKVLLESLIDKKVNPTLISKVENKNDIIIKTDTLKLESCNIIDEYLLVESLEDVEYFINKRCPDAINKNKFCEYFFEVYFTTDKSGISKLNVLLEELIKNQVLYKSNISKGLSLLTSRKTKINQKTDTTKSLLIFLKSHQITKGIEHLFERYKINL